MLFAADSDYIHVDKTGIATYMRAAVTLMRDRGRPLTLERALDALVDAMDLQLAGRFSIYRAGGWGRAVFTVLRWSAPLLSEAWRPCFTHPWCATRWIAAARPRGRGRRTDGEGAPRRRLEHLKDSHRAGRCEGDCPGRVHRQDCGRGPRRTEPCPS